MSEEKQTIKLVDQNIRKMGNFHYVSIPKAFIDNNILSMSKKYQVVLIEIGEDESKTINANHKEKVQT